MGRHLQRQGRIPLKTSGRAFLLKNLDGASDVSLLLGLDSLKIVTLFECLLDASTAKTSRENLVPMGFVVCGST